MKVYAVRSPETFTRVSNAAARDARLSYKARGLLLYLLSHQDGYNLSVAALRAASTDGKDAIATGLAELEGAGYLVRVRVRAPKGQLGAVCYVVADDPGLIDASAVAAEVGGRIVAADATARYNRTLAGNPPNKAANGLEFAENPPIAENPPKADFPPEPGFPASGNPAAKEDKVKENQDHNSARAVGVVVSSIKPKAPNSPAEGFGGVSGVKPHDKPHEALSGAKKPGEATAHDATLPKTNGRAELSAAERWGYGAFVAAWDEAVGGLAPWSAANKDLAHHALSYWAEAEILSVLASMARGRRDISSPLRYFASGLEKKAREVRNPIARRGTKKAAQLDAAPPKTPPKAAPDAALDLDSLPPEVRAKVEAKMREMK